MISIFHSINVDLTTILITLYLRFAYWAICHAFLVSAEVFSKNSFNVKQLDPDQARHF